MPQSPNRSEIKLDVIEVREKHDMGEKVVFRGCWYESNFVVGGILWLDLGSRCNQAYQRRRPNTKIIYKYKLL